MRIHFIAIGGSAMHSMAIALHKKGYHVTGSDDEINEPSKSRLQQYGLLPVHTGWFPERITPDINAIILGMHARADNPELQKAQKTGLKIYSYPEYIYEQSRDKTRVVIGGSHGKTTITAMVLHALIYHKTDCDYMVGAELSGLESTVRLTGNSRIIILEGDEYLSSPIDRRPKFHLYKADIALLNGIAWDHINVFPTYQSYVEQFRIFVNNIPLGGCFIYNKLDAEVCKIAEDCKKRFIKLSYGVPEHIVENGVTSLLVGKERLPLKIFGKHNLINLEGARNVCSQLGLNYHKFYEAIASFRGAAKRLELVNQNAHSAVYKDFAHSPSKLLATIHAVKMQYPGRKLTACIELHTFSSLNHKFLQEYKNTMNEADEAIVYFNPHTIEHKKLPPISSNDVHTAFGRSDILVFNDSKKLADSLQEKKWENRNLLMMSSGNFDGINLEILAKDIMRQISGFHNTVGIDSDTIPIAKHSESFGNTRKAFRYIGSESARKQ